MNKLVLFLAMCVLSTSALANSGFSAELMAGSATQRIEPRLASGNISGDDASHGIRFGWQFWKHMAIETSYQNYGKAKELFTYFDGTSSSDWKGAFEMTAINAGVRAIIPFENGFSLSARGGISRWDYDAEYTQLDSGGTGFFDDDDGTDFYFGASLRYDFDNFFISGDYTVVDADIKFDGSDAEHKTKDFSFAIGRKF